jgi:hypothetical protein
VDDADYYLRLRQSGVRERQFPGGLLRELPRGNEVRVSTSFQTDLIQMDLKEPHERMLYMLSRNTCLAMLRPWSASLRRSYQSRRRRSSVSLVELAVPHAEYRTNMSTASYQSATSHLCPSRRTCLQSCIRATCVEILSR